MSAATHACHVHIALSCSSSAMVLYCMSLSSPSAWGSSCLGLGPRCNCPAPASHSHRHVFHLHLWINALEHWGILEHIWNDDKPDAAAPDEDMLKMGYSAVLCCGCNVLQLAVPVIFSFVQFSPVSLSRFQLDRERVALSFMQKFDWDAHTLGRGHPMACPLKGAPLTHGLAAPTCSQD